MLAKHLSRRVPENMNHIYVLFLLGYTLVKAFSSENTKKKKKLFEALQVFMSQRGQALEAGVGGSLWLGGVQDASPEARLLALCTDPCCRATGEPQLAEKSRFSVNMTPFTL